MAGTTTRGTVREMWQTRPSRPRAGRQVAGVAAAVAQRYDIDPVLVRVVLVATALTGAGALLYLLGWAVLPAEPGDGHRPRPRPLIVVGLVLATVFTVGALFGGTWDGPGRFDPPPVPGAPAVPDGAATSDGFTGPPWADGGDDGVTDPPWADSWDDGDRRDGGEFAMLAAGTLVVLGLLFLLHRSRGRRGPSTPAAVAGTPRDVPVDGGAAGDRPAGSTPPAWDPLGAAPFAWDLPEPPPAVEPARRRPVLTAVTSGIALLAAGIVATVLLATGLLGPTTAPVIGAVALAVLGGGLVVGSFRRTGRALIPLAAVLALVTWTVATGPFDRFAPDPAATGASSTLRAAPVTVAELRGDYQRGSGDVRLDLRGLADDLATTAVSDTDVAVRIRTGSGDIRVTLPADVDVAMTASSGTGEVEVDDQQSRGPGAQIVRDLDLGADGRRAGRLLVLTAQSGSGWVEVRRG